MKAVLIVSFEVPDGTSEIFDKVVPAVAAGLASHGIDRQVKGTWGAVGNAAEGVLTIVKEWRT